MIASRGTLVEARLVITSPHSPMPIKDSKEDRTADLCMLMYITLLPLLRSVSEMFRCRPTAS